MIAFYFTPQYISYSFPISILISAAYFGFVYKRFFPMSLGKAFFLSLISLIGGFIFMILSIFLVGMLIALAIIIFKKTVG